MYRSLLVSLLFVCFSASCRERGCVSHPTLSKKEGGELSNFILEGDLGAQNKDLTNILAFLQEEFGKNRYHILTSNEFFDERDEILNVELNRGETYLEVVEKLCGKLEGASWEIGDDKGGRCIALLHSKDNENTTFSNRLDADFRMPEGQNDEYDKGFYDE
jgi:hypothetical protein